MRTRRRFDRQFKVDAVRLLETSGKTAVEVAENLEIPRDPLSRWKREMNEENIRAFPGHSNPRDEVLGRLRRKIAGVKMERDILKKAVAIFSKPENRNTNSWLVQSVKGRTSRKMRDEYRGLRKSF